MWFDKVEEVLSSAGLDPSDPATAAHLWNCDETAFCTSVSATKLVVRKGTKMVHEVGGGSGREYTTIHCAGSGSVASFCTRERTCTRDGWRVAQQQQYMG